MNDQEFKEKLTQEQYHILRERGTEAPFSGKFLDHKEDGSYTCAACGNVLFASGAKFDSHCGWPSFDRDMGEGTVTFLDDTTLGMTRTEVRCAQCGSHLGHIFDDGPTETGKRYCINSLSLGFQSVDKQND